MRVPTADDRDLRHTLEAFVALCREPRLRRERLIAEASGATVTVHGFVSEPGMKDLAAATVRALPWVETVCTYIAVEEPGPPEERSGRPEASSRRFFAGAARSSRRSKRTLELSGGRRMKGAGT